MVQKSSTSNSENQIATLNNLNKSYKDKDILKEINIEYRTTRSTLQIILIQFLYQAKLWRWIQHSKTEWLYIFSIA